MVLDNSEVKPAGTDDSSRSDDLRSLVRKNRYAAKTTAVVNGPNRIDNKKRTYVIVGNGRGGTSMVAGVAHLLGLELNHKNYGGGGFEDGDFVLTAQGLDGSKGLARPLNLSRREITKRLRDTVEARNAEYDVWGWKDPEAFNYLSQISDLMPDPHLILVWRDPAAIATAIMEANDLTPEDAFSVVLRNIRDFWKQVQATNWPTLMVSYERGRLKPQEMAAEMADFMGLELTEEKLAEIVEFVSPAGGYLVHPNSPSAEEQKEMQKYLDIVPGAPTVDLPKSVVHGDELVIRWQPDPNAGPQRRAKVTVSAHGRTWTPKIVVGSDTQVSLNAEENRGLFAAPQFSVQVCTLGAGGESPLSEPQTVEILPRVPVAPIVEVPSSIDRGDELVIRWQPDASAGPQRGAEIAVSNRARTWTPKRVTGRDTEARLDAERNKAVFAAKKIGVQVRTKAAGGHSPWSEPQEVEIRR